MLGDEILERQESLLMINNESSTCPSFDYGFNCGFNYTSGKFLNTENIIKELPAAEGQSVQFICSLEGYLNSIEVIDREDNKINIDKVNWPKGLKQISEPPGFSIELFDAYLKNAYLRVAKLNETKTEKNELNEDIIASEDKIHIKTPCKDVYKLYITQKIFGGMKRNASSEFKAPVDKDKNDNDTLPQESKNLSNRSEKYDNPLKTHDEDKTISFNEKIKTSNEKMNFPKDELKFSNEAIKLRNINKPAIFKEKLKRYLDEDPELLEQIVTEVEKVKSSPRYGIQIDIKAISSIKVIPSIFKIISQATDMKCVMIGRVTNDKWIACSVADNPYFPMKPGDELELAPTICNEVWKYHKPIAIDHAEKDPIYHNHGAPKLYGFQSYISVPLIRKNGCFFGTLCAIDPAPAKLNNSQTIEMFQLFADLISFHLQTFEEIEEGRKSNQAKTKLVSHVSHEIRTPLSGILGFLELALREKECSDTIKEYLTHAYNSTLSLKTVADDILDLTKMESEVFKLETIPFSPLHVSQEVIAGFKIAADKKNVTFKLKETERVPQVLMGDPLRFKQILLNLVGNSLKFTQQGSIKVKLDGISDVKQPSQFRFKGTVKDTGVGMDNETCERLFSPFMQGDDSTAREFGGTGLGLCITKQLCEKMRGNIKVSSELGLGSRFEFIIYFKLPETIITLARNNLLMGETKKLPELNILVAEDNLINQRLLKLLLEKEKCKITLANNGQEALSEVEKQKFDLILMDGEMPVMNGIEATQLIRAKFSNLNLPIIGLTGHAMNTHKEIFLKAGMNGYLTKPINKQTLHNEILRCLEIAQFKEFKNPNKKYKSGSF